MNNKEIYQKWMDAWNKDLSNLDGIADEDCTVHQKRTDGRDSGQNKGQRALAEVITSGRHYFDDVEMTLEIAPVAEGDYVSARWNFTGTYNGKMAGASAAAGTEMSFSGMDIFRIENGRIQDYWVSSDGIDLMTQLGIL